MPIPFPGMVILADALDPAKKGVGAAQAGCLGDLMPKAIERCLVLAKFLLGLDGIWDMENGG